MTALRSSSIAPLLRRGWYFPAKPFVGDANGILTVAPFEPAHHQVRPRNLLEVVDERVVHRCTTQRTNNWHAALTKQRYTYAMNTTRDNAPDFRPPSPSRPRVRRHRERCRGRMRLQAADRNDYQRTALGARGLMRLISSQEGIFLPCGSKAELSRQSLRGAREELIPAGRGHQKRQSCRRRTAQVRSGETAGGYRSTSLLA